jgi:hypothetical protein
MTLGRADAMDLATVRDPRTGEDEGVTRALGIERGEIDTLEVRVLVWGEKCDRSAGAVMGLDSTETVLAR